MKKTYNYNNEVYTTLTAIAKVVGKSRIYQKDFAKYGITVNEPAVSTPDDVSATYTTAMPFVANTVTYTTAMTTLTTSVTSASVKAETEDEFPEVTEVEFNVVNMTRFTLGKAISKFTIEALIVMAKNAGIVNFWERIENKPIRKMRLIMEIKEAYFPIGNKKSSNPPSPWKGIATDTLIKAATERGITWKVNANDGINRMRVIMALKANDVKPDTLQ